MYALDLVAVLILLHVLAGQGAITRLVPAWAVSRWAGRVVGLVLAVSAGVAVFHIVGGIRQGQAAGLWPWVMTLLVVTGFAVYRGVRALSGRAGKRV